MPKKIIPLPERESVTLHRKQYLNEILLPILISVLVVCCVVVALATVTLRSGGSLANAADISLIWMMTPLLFVSLIGLAILVLAIYGMSLLLENTEPITGKVQNRVFVINEKIQAFTARLVKPIINLRVWIEFLGSRKGK